MKFFKKILPMVLSLLLVFPTAVACSGGGSREGTIWIKYFEGGFGSAWLESAVEAYKSENPGVEFKLEKDASLRTNAPVLLEAGIKKDIPDIIMSQFFNWNEAVENGSIATLDDIYNKPVTEVNGSPVLLKDYIADDIAGYPWTPAIPGATVKHAWILPWSSNTVSLAYNEDLLKKTRKNGSTTSFWSAPPTTETELKQLVEDIKATNAANGYTSAVYPFVWPGSALNWLTFMHTTWWAQYQGIGESHPAGEGNWYDFWNFETKEVYLQSGLVEGYRLLQDLFVDKATSTWKNSVPNMGSATTTEAEIEFIKGNAVMMPVGAWLENEMKDFMSESSGAYPNIKENLRMMVLPAINGARSTNINNAFAEDLICVPEMATNKELAKDFLLFLSKPEQLVKFTKTTGMMRPFKYDPVVIDPDHPWTTFQKDTISLFTDSKYENFYEYSYKESPLYIFKRLKPYMPTISTAVGYNLSKTPKEVVDEIYNGSIKNNWSTWCTQYGVEEK